MQRITLVNSDGVRRPAFPTRRVLEVWAARGYQPETGQPEPSDDLSTLTRAQLVAVAEAEGVDLTGAKTNAERAAAILSARKQAAADQSPTNEG